MSKKKLIVIISVTLIISAGLIIWGLIERKGAPSEKELLREIPNLPEDQWPRVVTVKEGEPGHKVATNKFDRYEIIVPSEWQVLETANVNSGFTAFYDSSGSTGDTEFTQGVMLNILTFENIERIKSFFPSSTRFEDREIPAGRAYRTSYKVSQDIVIKGESTEVPIEDSLVVKYIFPTDKKVYLISCMALGDNFNELASLCEKQILTFKILK